MDEPDVLKKFKIFKKIGKGGSAEIYKAEYLINKKECALKIIDKEILKHDLKCKYLKEDLHDELNDLINIIKQEAKFMEVCKSKNIVELYEYFEKE